MKYETHKRTKSLTLRDIHVGDWVQCWEDVTETYSSPLKIIQICDDGFIHLVQYENERSLPWVSEITDIDALPIDGDLLRGFGFERNDYVYSFRNSVFAIDNQLDVMDFTYIDKYWQTVELEDDIVYMHELQQALHEERNFIDTFSPEWKGID